MTQRMQNAFQLLRDEHSLIKSLFTKFTAAGNDWSAKQKLARQIAESIHRHTFVEEEVLYPAVRVQLPGGLRTAGQCESEHKQMFDKMINISKFAGEQSEKLDSELSELLYTFNLHSGAEETNIFPELERLLTDRQLQQLKSDLEAVHKNAPSIGDAQWPKLGDEVKHGSDQDVAHFGGLYRKIKEFGERAFGKQKIDEKKDHQY